MDGKAGGWLVTPRIGKPVEVQALWLNAQWIGSQFNTKRKAPFTRGLESFHDRFWNQAKSCLYDVIDADHQSGNYQGGVRDCDGAYHQGTVWPWLIGAFVEAWLRVHGDNEATRREARGRFLTPIFAHLNHAGLGRVSEIADAELPHTPRGCPFLAWSLAELLSLDRVVLAERTSRQHRIATKQQLNERL
jgi:glycogen debranching enzyme